MLPGMQKNQIIHTLLVGKHSGPATVEHSLAFPLKIKNGLLLQASNYAYIPEK